MKVIENDKGEYMIYAYDDSSKSLRLFAVKNIGKVTAK